MMGILTGIARWIIRILFVFSIALLLITATVAHFSAKENLKPVVQEIAISQMNESQFSEMSSGLKTECQRLGKETIEQYVSDINQNIVINCSKTSSEDVKEIFKEQIIGGMIDNAYAQKCSGLSCFASPLAMISESAHKIFQNLEIIMFGAVLVFAALLFLLSKGISGRLFSIGSPVIIAGMPYFFIDSIKSKVLASMPSGSAAVGAKVADIILNYLSGLFLILLAAGALLIIAGLVVRFILKIK